MSRKTVTLSMSEDAVQELAKAALAHDPLPVWAYAELCAARRAVGLGCPELDCPTDPDGAMAVAALVNQQQEGK